MPPLYDLLTPVGSQSPESSSHMGSVSLPCLDKCLRTPASGYPWTVVSSDPRGSRLGNVAEPDWTFSHQEMLRSIWGHFLRVIQGKSPTLSHSSSLLHGLGSVTVRGPA